MKYVADQKGIIDRYIKEASGWASHLENTKNVIIKGAEGRTGGNCAVLGSGWLLDVPIEFLSQHFDKVYLFDVLHPTQVKHKMAKFKNVILIEQDITGGAIREFFDAVQMQKSMKKRKNPEEISIGGFNYPVEFNYVVSVNILNQLDILIIDYIKSYSLYSESELQSFRVQIQQKHLESLPKNKSLLITDYEELVMNDKNEIEEKFPLLYVNLPEQQILQKWQWDFDHKDYRAGKNIIFNVVAVNL